MTEPTNEGRANAPTKRQLLRIDPETWQQIRIRAIEEGRQTFEVVNDALREYLAKGGDTEKR